MSALSEIEMRNALGIPMPALIVAKERRREPRVKTPALLVVLSVRESWGGPCRRFAHRCNTVSTLLAQCEANKAARAQGLVVWALLEIGPEV